MEDNLIIHTDNVYKTSQECKLEYFNIDYPELFIFTRNLKKFINRINDVEEDDFWKDRKRRLKRLGFLFSSAPMDYGLLQNQLDQAITFFETDLTACEKLYPDHSSNYTNLINDLNLILNTEFDIIKKNVDSVIQVLDGSIAILIKDTKLIPIIQKYYNSQKIDIVSTNSLKNNITYDNLIVIGSSSDKWFPEYIFSSPRAKKIFVIKYKWMKGNWQSKRVFPNSFVSSQFKSEQIIEKEPNETDEYIDPELILPTIDFSSIITSSWKQFEEEEGEIEFVEAIIGYLENDQFVFLDYDDSSTIRIIDIEDDEMPVKKIRVKELEPEMFLLLRTIGGGDYIVPLADRILGNKADHLRSTQKKWKDLLRIKRREMGPNGLIRELKFRGCSIANEINIQNWMSYRTIKTNQFSHFKIILDLIGLNEKAQDIWNEMGVITQAHIKAGRHITSLLLKKAKEADLKELMRLGIMEFELSDKDAGSITAYRIKALSDPQHTIFVTPTKIGIPMDIE